MAYTARANINYEGTKISRGKVISDSEYNELPSGLKKKFVGRPDKTDELKSEKQAKVSTAVLKDNTDTKATSESETKSTEKEESSDTTKSDETKTETKTGSKKDEEKTKESPKRQR